MRLETHWRLISWALLDKSLPMLYGVAFVLIVGRGLPPAEFGLQLLASAILLTLVQLLKALLLWPLIKFVAEGRDVERVAVTGTLLYVLACGAVAVLLAGGRMVWAGLFGKPELAPVLVATAAWLFLGSGRDAGMAALEGQRRLRAVFLLDVCFYVLTTMALVVWLRGGAPRRADVVQWVQAAGAGIGSLPYWIVTRHLLSARPTRAEALRIVRFGRLSFGSAAAASLGQQADQLLAGRLMDARGFAAYGAAKLCFRGFNILAQAISQVMMPVVSRLQASGRREALRVLFEKSVCFLYLGLVPICLALVILARPLFHLLYQDRYDDSVLPFQVLVLSGLTLPLASIGSPFLIGLGQLRSLFWISWGGLGLTLGLELLWVPQFGPLGAALAVLAGSVAGMVARTWVLHGLLGFRLAGIAARHRDATDFLRRRLGLS